MPESLAHRALIEIRRSSVDDFTSSLAWAQWCREVAEAALAGDDDLLETLTNPEPVADAAPALTSTH